MTESWQQEKQSTEQGFEYLQNKTSKVLYESFQSLTLFLVNHQVTF